MIYLEKIQLTERATSLSVPSVRMQIMHYTVTVIYTQVSEYNITITTEFNDV